MIDFQGRSWTRTGNRLDCEDGSTVFISDGMSDEQAMSAVQRTWLESRKQALDQAIEGHLNVVAQSLGYVSMERACTYVPSTAFGAEARSLLDWRDAVWLHAISVLQAVESGQRPVPTEEELIAELPSFAP